ncbi:hypothetical protein THAOC_21360, partial [Thalassiosira oceanica]
MVFAPWLRSSFFLSPALGPQTWTTLASTGKGSSSATLTLQSTMLLIAYIGGEGHSFFVVREPCRNLQVPWAEVFGGVHRAVNRLLDEQQRVLGWCPQRDVDLERAIKIHSAAVGSTWPAGGTLLGSCGTTSEMCSWPRSLSPPPAGRRSDENRVRRAADLMSRSKYGKARKEMLNNGLANKDDPRVEEGLDREGFISPQRDVTPGAAAAAANDLYAFAEN